MLERGCGKSEFAMMFDVALARYNNTTNTNNCMNISLSFSLL